MNFQINMCEAVLKAEAVCSPEEVLVSRRARVNIFFALCLLQATPPLYSYIKKGLT